MSMSRDRFLQEYKLSFDKEFEVDGHAAEWAPGTSGPRFWGAEDRTLDLVETDPISSHSPTTTVSSSPDQKFLAAATNAVIRVYDLASFQLRAELIGHETHVGDVSWAPIVKTSDATGLDTKGEDVHYRLLSAGTSAPGNRGQIILWSLDGKGRQIDRIMPFAVDALARKAIDAMSTDLIIHHDLTAQDIETIRTGIITTLVAADTRNRRKHLKTLDGTFGHFGSSTWSSDGSRAMYIAHGRTTQHGMRPPGELPQVVVYDLAEKHIALCLKGHTDSIMWAAWSPDNAIIATASWDQTYRIWDSTNGVCRHVLGPTNGQNWSGAFSPDGKHLLLSGGQPTRVTVRDVGTGEEIAHYSGIGERRTHWIRKVAWHPRGDCIALVDGQSVVLWSPFTATQDGDQRKDGVWTEVLKLKSDGSMLENFCRLSDLHWVDRGAKLLVQTSDHTTLLWDRERMWKWRFQRPMGTPLELYECNMGFRSDGKNKVIWSNDGDWKVREWTI